MAERTFEDGYRDGWESVAGEEPMPAKLTLPAEGEPLDYEHGFRYGASEAAMHFKPGTSDTPLEPV